MPSTSGEPTSRRLALGQHEGGFESLLEAVPDALVAVDRSGVIRYVNRRAQSLFGVFRHECGSPNGFELGFLLLRQRFWAGAAGLWFVPVLRRFFSGSRQFG